MHGPFLADLSTLIWLIVTSALFVVLAHWSTGDSWGLTGSIVRGIRGWAEHDRRAPIVSSPFIEPLSPLLAPGRPIGGVAAARSSSAAAPPRVEAEPLVEVVDLGEHRIRG